MSHIKISQGESFEMALKRFNRKAQQDGILTEARRREYYENPSTKRKRKAATQQHRIKNKR